MSNEKPNIKGLWALLQRTVPAPEPTQDNISYFIPSNALITQEYLNRLFVPPVDLASGRFKFSSWNGETVFNNLNVLTHLKMNKSHSGPTIAIKFTSFSNSHNQSSEEWSIQEMKDRMRVMLIRLMGSRTSLLLPQRSFSDDDKDSYAFLKSIDIFFHEAPDQTKQSLLVFLKKKSSPQISPIRTTHHINRESTQHNLEQADKNSRFTSLEEALGALSRLKTIIESSTTIPAPPSTLPSGPILPYTS